MSLDSTKSHDQKQCLNAEVIDAFSLYVIGKIGVGLSQCGLFQT